MRPPQSADAPQRVIECPERLGCRLSTGSQVVHVRGLLVALQAGGVPTVEILGQVAPFIELFEPFLNLAEAERIVVIVLAVGVARSGWFWPTHSPRSTADGFLHRLFSTQKPVTHDCVTGIDLRKWVAGAGFEPA